MRILEVGMSGTVGTIHMGPVSTVLCELSNRFAAAGHEVTVIDARNEERRPLLHAGIRVVELASLPPSRGPTSTLTRIKAALENWRYCYRFARQLGSLVDLAGMDVVHMHSAEFAFVIQRMHGVRGFYTAHTPVWSLQHKGPVKANAPRSTGAGRLYARLVASVERRVARRAGLTIGLGSYLGAALPDARVVCIPNGIDCEAWRPLDRATAREALGIEQDDFVLLFTGRIVRIKGVDVLLEAVRSLTKDIPQLKVFIIGSLSGSFDSRDEYVGAYATAMTESARGLPVRFLGFINNRELLFKQYCAAADLSVVPSRVEPQGLVVLESLAMGTPVIASNTGGIPDMVSADVGYLFPPEDSAALAACIREAHAHPERLQDMRRAARAQAERKHSWDGVAQRYLAAFAASIAASAEEPGP